MNKIKLTIYFIFVGVFISACSEILEPVLISGKINQDIDNIQEEFNIKVNALTFQSARDANKSPYPRELMLTGSGTRANVVEEKILLDSTIPKQSNNLEYTLGYGDELTFTLISEFKNEKIIWPENPRKNNYILGIGDELKFIQFSEPVNIPISIDDETGGLSKLNNTKDQLISTKGVIGSDGNILLIGMGNIKAANRSLNNVRNEVRNILIRNGLTPNFQLEITNFRSKKAYINIDIDHDDIISSMLPINNIPLTLKQAVLGAGISESSNKVKITLTRGREAFSMTGSQLFDKAAPNIFIQDQDEINIQVHSDIPIKHKAVIGSNGNILLPGIGNINVVNSLLKDVQNKISNILQKKGLKTLFQLELTKYKSKKVYLIQKNVSSSIIPLSNKKVSLRELLLNAKSFVEPKNGLLLITLTRNKKSYRIPANKLLDPNTPDIWVQSEDQIEVEILNYKPGQVYALSGAGNATAVTINPSQRETLANILFTPGGALSNSSAKRSEVYLLRGRGPSIAYHLDAQNVSRILVAAETELRPNDIIYVAERPIISFSRLLSEITPLRILLKDIQDNNIP